MIDELELLRQERPEVQPARPEVRRRAERELHAAMAVEPDRRPRRLASALRIGLSRLAPVAALLVVAAVVLVFLGAHNRRPAVSSGATGPELVFAARPTGPVHQVKVGAVARAASILQQLVRSLPGDRGQSSVTSTGQRIVVHLGRSAQVSRPELISLIDMTGRLVFYDWEADALTPTGRPVAGALVRQNPSALLISQGGGTLAPGTPGAGSLSLYPAVKLAAQQPSGAVAAPGRPGPQYFAFGPPGSSACATAAAYYLTRDAPGGHCYLAGPAPTVAQTLASLPRGVPASQADTLMVPPGIVVLQATPSNFARRPSLSEPAAQFYVLRDHPGLFGGAAMKPAPSTDPSGSAVIALSFTAKGATAFQAMTARVARRGALVSGLGQTLNQHFAVALGDQLLTVPSIDFRTYPDGVPGGGGADLTGGFTAKSLQLVGTEVELGALPVVLQLVSSG